MIEPTFGVDRTILVLLLDAYDEEATVDVNGKPDTRIVLRLRSEGGAVQGGDVAADEEAGADRGRARHLRSIAGRDRFLVDYDETGNIGKRYRRQDEMGTPFCFTVDPESLEDGKVTVRDRDTTEQERIDDRRCRFLCRVAGEVELKELSVSGGIIPADCTTPVRRFWAPGRFSWRAKDAWHRAARSRRRVPSRPNPSRFRKKRTILG